MRERPILFGGPMVRAILDGRKTQTRRIVRGAGGAWTPHVEPGGILWRSGEHEHRMSLRCPYGAPGDRLWVRETWANVHPLLAAGRASGPSTAGIPGPPGVDYRVVYRADGELAPLYYSKDYPYRSLAGADQDLARRELSWESPVCMPRKSSRLTLEVVSVRVERLQDISEEDARAEGVAPFFERFPGMGQDQTITTGERAAAAPHRASFACLWDEINGDRALWKSNPWVWVVEFKRAEPTPGQTEGGR